MAVITPQITQPIVNRLGIMTNRFQAWAQQVTRAAPLRGSGTPETFVPAFENQLYVDTAGGAGAVLYVKRDADIGGDRSKGWILV